MVNCKILIKSSFLNDIFAFCSSSSGSSRPISTSLMSDAFVSTPRKFSHCLYFLLQGHWMKLVKLMKKTVTSETSEKVSLIKIVILIYLLIYLAIQWKYVVIILGLSEKAKSCLPLTWPVVAELKMEVKLSNSWVWPLLSE